MFLGRNPWLKKVMALRLLANGGMMSPLVVKNYMQYKLTPHRAEIGRFPRPVICTLVVTVRCNLKCDFCIVPKGFESSDWRPYEADEVKIKRILDHPLAKRAMYVGLTGGEPLMVRDLPRLVRLIRKKGRLCGLVTNGQLLENQIRDLKRAGLNVITVSFYDHTKDKLGEILGRVNPTFRCRANKILMRSEVENKADYLEEIVRLSRDSGCTGLYFGNYLPHGTEATDEIIYEDNEAYRDLRSRLTEKYSDFLIYWPRPLKRTLSGGDKKCRLPWYYMIADMRGNLGLCNQHMPPLDGSYGNLFTSTYHGSVNHPVRLDMREKILGPNGMVPTLCRDCPIMCDDWHADY